MSGNNILMCDLQDNIDIEKTLRQFEENLQQRTYYHFGYPYNLDYDFTALQSLIHYSINNLGDPFIESNYGVQSRPFEVAILEWFADLWEISKEEYWGYVTSCGTEGNLYGIWLGREHVTHCKTEMPLLIASEETHYSVWKAARMFKMEAVPINTCEKGEICLSHLETVLKQAHEEKRKVVIVGNVGTTIKGAFDDIRGIIKLLNDNGFTDEQYFIHLDGALSGTIIPFLDDEARDKCLISFQNKAIGSISASGHKFIGSPIPCGIVVTRKKYINKLATDISYIASQDTTILGSRNGHAPLYMWYTIAKKGKEGIKRDILECFQNAEYLYNSLVKHKISDLLLNKHSSTVVFKRPDNEAFVIKWQLACHKNVCHVVVMPNITKVKIHEFVTDLMCNGYTTTGN